MASIFFDAFVCIDILFTVNLHAVMGGHGEGGGHGHGGHGEKFQVPDWRQYKIDGIKALEWTQQSLAAKGLRDPWLRLVHILIPPPPISY